MLLLGFGAAVFLLFLLAGHHWHDLNSNDLGTMSPKWLAEYNAQHQ